MNKSLNEADPQMVEAMLQDLDRLQNSLTLIPSENYTSKAVMQAQASILANKYAEGYPAARYYNGCQFVDRAESLAIERAKRLFGAEHVNVQPHAGNLANMAVYYALLEPGDTILSMKLDHGGHLSHGLPQNFSGRYYNIVPYGVDAETERVNMNTIAELAKEHRPKLIVVGASAYPRWFDFAQWREIADAVGAYLLADIAHIAGLIAADVHPDPVPYCDVITTTTHKTLRGPRGAIIMCRKQFAEAIDRAVFPGIQGGPFMHTIAAKGVAFKEAMEPAFKKYQNQIVKNAKALAEGLSENGFHLVTGGTDNHLMLIDLTATYEQLSGRQAADHLEEAGIIVNKNTIPFDKRSATTTSGIRLGTPMVSARGMKEEEMKLVADFISETLQKRKSSKAKQRVREKVRELCQQFPIYEDLNLWS
ncbi:MAG: serine hydroxymethyltransferase [Candidatus Poribacteria bacterium]|nr:serine hydroxymethyltransferase [Candidatus Poribacteria bacterium]